MLALVCITQAPKRQHADSPLSRNFIGLLYYAATGKLALYTAYEVIHMMSNAKLNYRVRVSLKVNNMGITGVS